MQDQPKPDMRRAEKVQRARQARTINEDAFKGGEAPRKRLRLKSPWLSGSGRLWNAQRPGVSEE
jgi:hypothetical protein